MVTDERLVFRLLTADDGDRVIPFDPNDPAQVAQARSRFEALTKQGYRAYRMGPRGQAADRILDFDPRAGEILFTGKGGFQGG